jgi:acylphosphatase
LKGWVRNLLDGRVEAVVKGPASVLEEFEKRVRRGPPAGRVDAMVIGEPPAEEWTDFEVRKDGSKPCVE